jgi:hypothetical protein
MSCNGADGSVLGNAEYAARLSTNFKIKECPAFISTTGKQTKGPKVLCFNDADIPLTVEGFKDRKQINVGLVVVDCLSDGYTRVPYECTNNRVYNREEPHATLRAERVDGQCLWWRRGGRAEHAYVLAVRDPGGMPKGQGRQERGVQVGGWFSRLRLHFHTWGAKCADLDVCRSTRAW